MSSNMTEYQINVIISLNKVHRKSFDWLHGVILETPINQLKLKVMRKITTASLKERIIKKIIMLLFNDLFLFFLYFTIFIILWYPLCSGNLVLFCIYIIIEIALIVITYIPLGLHESTPEYYYRRICKKEYARLKEEREILWAEQIAIEKSINRNLKKQRKNPNKVR
jgi:hypothetical protein